MDEQQPPQYPPPPPPEQQYYAPPPPQQQYYPPAPPAEGLSDTAASAIAYLTIIPSIIFLVMEPYNRKPIIKFHAFQNIGLAVCGFCLGIIGIIPILGWIIFIVGMLTLLVTWILCIVNAAQGKMFKVPIIGNFAAQQAGLV